MSVSTSFKVSGSKCSSSQTMQLFIGLLLAGVAQFALNANALPNDPTKRDTARTSGYGYATFYNDNACSQGQGIAVSMGNSGCLANEYGRNSIYVQPGWWSGARLVWSPGNTCNCQNHCADVGDNGGRNYCWNLNGNPGASSFRFITEGCGGNNC